MITKITVKSFKSLENVTVELGLVNVFIGPNGSGKTNFLEALGIIGAAASGRVDDESLLRRGVRPGLPVLYKSSFHAAKESEDINFYAETENANYEVGLFNPSEKPKLAWSYHTEKLIENDGKIFDRSPSTKERNGNPEAGRAALKLVEMEPDSPAAKLLEVLRNYNLYTPITNVLRGLVPDPQRREPVGLSGGRLPEAVEEMGAKFIGDLFSLIEWIIGFGVGFEKSIEAVDASQVPVSPSVPSSRMVLKFHDKFMKSDRNILTGYDASEGALYILFNYVLALHEKSPKLLAIDNADHGLNPRLARRLMECMCKWLLAAKEPRQILLTTHNPLVLDGLPLLDDRIRLFTVDRSNKGKTVINRVKVNEEMMAKAGEGWTLSRLWIMGNLGGMPNV